MKKEFVTVVYDRKKRLEKTGKGKVELHIHLNCNERKYITIKECTPLEWKRYQQSNELRMEIAVYQTIAENMVKCGEEMLIENYNRHLGISTKKEDTKQQERRKRMSSPRGFIDFIEEGTAKEGLEAGTLKSRKVVVDALDRYGYLNRFADVTPENVKGFDEFLREEDKNRSDITLNNYHKVVKKYAKAAYERDYIPKNPYDSPLCKFKRGECKERKPLTEDELQKVYKLKKSTGGEESVFSNELEGRAFLQDCLLIMSIFIRKWLTELLLLLLLLHSLYYLSSSQSLPSHREVLSDR